MSIYKFGQFQLDRDKRLLLEVGGAALPLTPKAYDTLVYLVARAGTIVDKDELMRAIWPNTAVEENNLTQNISMLRRVLGEARGEHRYIATYRDVAISLLRASWQVRALMSPRRRTLWP